MNMTSILYHSALIYVLVVVCDSAKFREPEVLRESNREYNASSIYEFPGLVKNPLWVFSSVAINISCTENGKPAYSKYFTACTKEEALEKVDSNYWVSDASVNGTVVWFVPFSKNYIGVFMDKNIDRVCSVRMQLKKVEPIYVGILTLSLLLFIIAPYLSKSTTVHYSSGTLVGVFGFLLVLAYLLAKLIPGKKAMSGFLYFTGWSVTAYLAKLITHDFAFFLPYLACYFAVAGALSFAVTYYYGPIINPRAQDIICWSLRAVSFIGIYYSVQFEAVGFTIMILLMTRRFIPCSWIKIPGVTYFRMKWYVRYPPKRKLLTLEEYELQGQVETARALEELREYCLRAESQPWRLVKRLANPERMASFVEGDSHVTVTEKSMHDELLVSAVYSSDEEMTNSTDNQNENNPQLSDDNSLSVYNQGSGHSRDSRSGKQLSPQNSSRSPVREQNSR